MSNIIQIKRGSGVPNGELAPYELGIDISDNQLYFGGLFSGDKYGDAQGIKVAQAIMAIMASGAKKIIANDGTNLTIGSATTPIFLENGEFKTCGGSSISGTIEKAEMLATPRVIGVSLESGDYTKFNGQQDIVTGVKGILPIARGGTGANSSKDARDSLEITPQNIGALSLKTISLKEGDNLDTALKNFYNNMYDYTETWVHINNNGNYRQAFISKTSEKYGFMIMDSYGLNSQEKRVLFDGTWSSWYQILNTSFPLTATNYGTSSPSGAATPGQLYFQVVSS